MLSFLAIILDAHFARFSLVYNNSVSVINGSVVSQCNMDAKVSNLDIIFSHAVVKPRVDLNRHTNHPTLYFAFLNACN